MLIYNVTTQISWSIHEAWVQWMKEKHIDDVMNSGCFTDYRFVRILETDETDGPTYAVQFYAAGKTEYDNYIELHANKLRDDVKQTWGDQYFSFRSLMEVVA
ncbi:DUF4286 family protein [Sediminibacterium roseum]|uniref:DUF4286 family protein n=1 Tax=Sediminibacterium roseum TaxID=1978412 RepID=A0ABW9ZPQ8_9BACT|nr:DUF4286 family protein [Sediminibacterium roseum]NCI48510.1 DUF4286 family protein [Sediminibacterium roseum]